MINSNGTDAVGLMLSGNNIYNANKDFWKFLYVSYIGGDDYRRASLLTRYLNETDKEYNSRINSTPIENHCKSVIQTYTSFLFKQKATRELADVSELEDILKDADFDGRSFDDFIKESAVWASVFGHSWIVVAKPNVGARTKADEIAQGVRPYLAVINPLAMLDWAWSRSPNGAYVLDYIKYIEEYNGDVATVKEWTPDVVTTTIADSKKRTLSEPVMEENQLGFVPAVCVYSARSLMRGVGVSQISDIALAQQFIYNNTSEVQQSIRLDSHPSLVTTADVQVETGAGSVIKIPESLDAGLKPYVLDFSGANIDSIYKSIDHTVESIDKMALLGSIRSQEAKSMSGVALDAEFRLLDTKLSELADNLELAEEQLWVIIYAYQGIEGKALISYPESFKPEVKVTIAELKQAKDATTNPTLQERIDREILRLVGLQDSTITAGE
jgi:hypothetical protein